MSQFKYKAVLAPSSFLLLNCGEAMCQLVDTPGRVTSTNSLRGLGFKSVTGGLDMVV